MTDTWNEEDMEWYSRWLNNQAKATMVAVLFGATLERTYEFVRELIQDEIDEDYVSMIYSEATSQTPEVVTLH